jgi:outer membrane protein OmpA-like peptidoglycan-associated protein
MNRLTSALLSGVLVPMLVGTVPAGFGTRAFAAGSTTLDQPMVLAQADAECGPGTGIKCKRNDGGGASGGDEQPRKRQKATEAEEQPRKRQKATEAEEQPRKRQKATEAEGNRRAGEGEQRGERNRTGGGGEAGEQRQDETAAERRRKRQAEQEKQRQEETAAERRRQRQAEQEKQRQEETAAERRRQRQAEQEKQRQEETAAERRRQREAEEARRARQERQENRGNDLVDDLKRQEEGGGSRNDFGIGGQSPGGQRDGERDNRRAEEPPKVDDRRRERVKRLREERLERREQVRERRGAERERERRETLRDVREQRRERRDGDRVIIEEGGRRIVTERNGDVIIYNDERDRIRYEARDVEVRRLPNGYEETVVWRPNGVRVVTVRDRWGNVIERSRQFDDGRRYVLFSSNPIYYENRSNLVIDLPLPVFQLPRERYIVEAEAASPELIYETFAAPPVAPMERRYALEQVVNSPDLLDRVRRVDIDSITFASGSWQVDESQIGALDTIAESLLQLIEDNPAEVFLVEGHTDAVGADIDNLSLSDRRAEEVAYLLSEYYDVPAENLTTKGYGERNLKVPTSGPARENRRVTMRRITPLLETSSN